MTITLLGPAYPYRGGIAAFNDRLAIEFIEAGDDINIENFSLQYPEFLFPGKTQYNPSPAPSGVKMERSVNSVNPFNWIKVGRKIRKAAPDILIVRYWLPFMAPCLGTIARISKGNGKTQIVGLVDNIIPHERHFYDSMLSKYFIGAIDCFVVLSESVREELSHFTSKPCSLNPHPLYDIYGEKATRLEAVEKLNLDPDVRYLMFFGFIRDYKGLDLLLEAYAAGRFWERGVRLIVAGEFYGNADKYMKQASGLGITDKIVWHNDFIPDDEVRYWFAAADIVVQPYKTATQSGITQIGYNFEKPMIVTRVGGLAEIVPDGKAGYVVEPEAEALCAAISDFFFNRTPDCFEKGIAEEKKKYSWRAMIDCLKGL
ncbi:MAG: glycosyltransferase [Paludibacteraceae bacterium]|nr:glycosyltransferase [Paludibacteraceae bacterium]